MNMRRLQMAARSTADTIIRLLASERCFYGIVGFFVIEALWFTFTARYPMAFDEDFHFGLIKLHATQWLPFFTSQPAHADVYGAVVRDPSYLYHYLMSLPYRLIQLVTPNEIAQIIFLRLINVALFTYSLVLGRRLLSRLSKSRALNHSVMLLFCLVPIVPFLAAHINYDNLFIPVTLWACLATFDVVDELRAKRASFARLTILLSVLLLASIVKYPFMPVAVALGAFVLWQLWAQRSNWNTLWHSYTSSLKGHGIIRITALIVLLTVASGLFMERYAINIIRYHAPSPDCAHVLSVQRCMAYGPWARDYTYKLTGYAPNLWDYPWQWLYGMWQRSFFAISGTTFDTKAPLPLPGGTAIVLAIVGCILFFWYARTIVKQNIYRQGVLLAFVLYTVALFTQTFQSFLYTGIPVAINGRYMVPFLPIIFLFVGLAFQKLWQNQRTAKAFAFIIVTLLFLQGGGVLTYILLSDDSWNWPDTHVVQVNNTARKILKPVIVGSQR